MLDFIHIWLGFVTAFLYMLLYKIGFILYLRMHAPKLISKMADCLFCTNFWLSAVVHLIAYDLYSNVLYAVVSITVCSVASLLILKNI